MDNRDTVTLITLYKSLPDISDSAEGFQQKIVNVITTTQRKCTHAHGHIAWITPVEEIIPHLGIHSSTRNPVYTCMRCCTHQVQKPETTFYGEYCFENEFAMLEALANYHMQYESIASTSVSHHFYSFWQKALDLRQATLNTPAPATNCSHEHGYIAWKQFGNLKDGHFHYWDNNDLPDRTNYTCPLCFSHIDVQPPTLVLNNTYEVKTLAELKVVCNKATKTVQNNPALNFAERLHQLFISNNIAFSCN